jgi:translation initiation factor 2 subunit 1
LKNKGYPKRHELVVCRIKSINPHSATAHIIEYDKTGLIHVSEVASRWVRNIREFLKENQYVVCTVTDSKPDHISLSVKRVHKEDANRKLTEFKKENRSEKLLEMAGKSIKKDLKDVEDLLIEEFGSFTKVFETALKNPDLLRRKEVPGEWINAIVDIAKKNYAEKVFTVKGSMKLKCYCPNGIEVIKKALGNAKDVEVQYISAPNYVIWASGKNYKELEARVRSAGGQIVSEIEKSQGEASFEIEK